MEVVIDGKRFNAVGFAKEDEDRLRTVGTRLRLTAFFPVAYFDGWFIAGQSLASIREVMRGPTTEFDTWLFQRELESRLDTVKPKSRCALAGYLCAEETTLVDAPPELLKQPRSHHWYDDPIDGRLRHTILVRELRELGPLRSKAKPDSAPPPQAVIAHPPVEVSDYCVGRKEAARFAKTTETTITNWTKRGWLKVERQGRLIRYLKADLNNCKKRQE